MYCKLCNFLKGNTHAVFEANNTGHVVDQECILDIETRQLIIGEERVFVIGCKPVTGKLIDFGTELKCQEVLANLTASKLKKLDSCQSEEYTKQKISDLEERIRYLENENALSHNHDLCMT